MRSFPARRADSGADNIGQDVLQRERTLDRQLLQRLRRQTERQAGGDGAAEFAEGEALSPDQAALDAAIEQLPAEAIDQAVRTLLQPALEAIAEFSDAEQARQALADAYPRMDAAALESLLARAFFVADLLGSASAGEA